MPDASKDLENPGTAQVRTPATLLDLMGNWCSASGSEDEYRISEHMDTVQCSACQRWLYLSRQCRLPRHKREVRHAR